MIRRLIAEGVTVSIGHTDATYEQARAALKEGITHATHCFNAMRPLLHREPGPLGAIVESATVRGELIADGVHVHPAAMRALIGALGPERTVVVTDALPAAGLPDAVFTFGGQAARVVDGVARLADGTITGSVLTTAQALRNLLELADVPLAAAIQMLTINPARSARVETRKGRIKAGYDADLLVFDDRLELQATICRGRLAYVTDGWRERLAPMGEP
jgi:N-acetylglucosamine-6-phosphate deacetylase